MGFENSMLSQRNQAQKSYDASFQSAEVSINLTAAREQGRRAMN